MPVLTLILMFGGTFAIVLLVIFVARFIIDRNAGDAPEEMMFADEPQLLRGEEISTISPWATLLEMLNLTDRLKEQIFQAGLTWTVGRFTLLILLCGTVGLALLSKIAWLPLWAQLAGGLFCASIPYGWIDQKRTKRMLALEEQLPDALDSMARALRAGHHFTSAMDAVANQVPAPLNAEIRKTWAESSLGMPMQQALDNLAARIPLQEVAIFTSAVQLHSRSGGNLAEILDKLAENMREAGAVRGEVRSLSAQGRLAGRVLTVLPLFIGGMMVMVNPYFMQPMFESSLGRNLLSAGAISLVAAHFIIRYLVKIEP